ncbi:MAG: P-loop NTPase [Thermofilaceae archaeon]
MDPRPAIVDERLKGVSRIILDVYGPSCHAILGASSAKTVEDKGLIPPTVAGVKLMSINFFAEEQPLPLRGEEITDVLLELLAVTIWDSLDLLFIDSPPGTGEEILDTVKIVKRAEALTVTTPSRLSLSTVSRLVKLLRELRIPVLGLIENLGRGEDTVRRRAEEWGVMYLGWLPYYPDLEVVIGYPEKLVETPVAFHLRKALHVAQLI